MADTTFCLAALRSSTAALLLGLTEDPLSDADVTEPSLLPGWTRGHVLTHLARNADGIAATVAGALRGEVVARYPGGDVQRNADIEAGASRPAVDLIKDVRDSAERLDRVLAAAADADAWDTQCDTRTVGAYVIARWREVEVHRVDLGRAYAPARWPPDFVEYLVPELVRGLAERTTDALDLRIAAEGSVTTTLPGSHWKVGTGEAIQVKGPDWAIAAWLIGRPDSAVRALSATPELSAWM